MEKRTVDDQGDKELLELLQLMEEFTPMVPEGLIDYYMTKAGVECDDVRLKRLVALIAQKFVTDIANDAMHYNRLRSASSSTTSSLNTAAPTATPGAPRSKSSNTKKTVLTLEDLTAALGDYGINIKRPHYYT